MGTCTSFDRGSLDDDDGGRASLDGGRTSLDRDKIAEAVRQIEQKNEEKRGHYRDKKQELLKPHLETHADPEIYWNRQMSANALTTDEMFHSFDKNEDGQISEAELRTKLEEVGLCTEATAAEYMHALDSDFDGVITREEFVVFIDAAREILYPLYDAGEETATQAGEVFLGGSCNPTTWRKDIVMPFLDRNGVTYYNPQVDEWHEGLIALENRAKNDALVLFFVVDKQTRALSSMVEIAEMVTCGRHIILVIQDIDEGAVINDELVSQKQRKDLNRCRSYLADLVSRRGTDETKIVYTNIVQAAGAAVKLVSKLRHQQPLKVMTHRSMSVPLPSPSK